MILIEEVDVPGARRVELAGDDVPAALERETPAFESGGETKLEKIELPGRTRPIFQVLTPTCLRPLVLKGAFRDWLTSTGHARAMRDAIEALRRRANHLRIVWDGQEYTGVLRETKFGEESAHSITYELTFELDGAPQSEGGDFTAPPQAQSADIAAALRERLAARRAELAALRVEPSMLTRMLAALDNAVALVASVERELAALDAAVGGVTGRVRRVMGVSQSAINAVASLQRTVAGALALPRLLSTTLDSQTAAWKALLPLHGDLTGVLDGLAGLRARARARQAPAERLYRVRPGDTLESIACRFLGDARRAGELGVRAQDLLPGRLLRLPGAVRGGA